MARSVQWLCVLVLVLVLAVAMAPCVLAKDDKDKDKPAMAPVPISLYYESLCPDSIKFFTKQLYPTYEKFSKYMDITLVPYGKSKHIRSEAGNWTFDCHHGPAECYGNKVQACAIAVLTDMGDRMKYVNCLMDKAKLKSNDPYPSDKCASKLGFNLTPIETCANSTEGDDRLAMLGDKTNALQPKLTNVPTIIFKSNFNRKDQDMSMDDFKAVLCTYIGGNKENKDCPKSAAPVNQATILLSVAAAILIKIVS